MRKLIRSSRETFKEAKHILRTEGFKALFRRYGWKLVACVFTYYLIRDVTLYIIIPALIIRAATQGE